MKEGFIMNTILLIIILLIAIINFIQVNRAVTYFKKVTRKRHKSLSDSYRTMGDFAETVYEYINEEKSMKQLKDTRYVIQTKGVQSDEWERELKKKLYENTIDDFDPVSKEGTKDV